MFHSVLCFLSESSPKWDRWQHNGGGDLVTTLNNTDNIFILPQTRTLDQSAKTMRPQILLTSKNDRDQYDGRGVSDGKGYEQDYDRQVPLTNEYNFMSNRSQSGLFTSEPDYRSLDTKNLTWPNQQHNIRFEQQPLSLSLQPGYDYVPESHIPLHEYPHIPELLQHSSYPQQHPTLFKSHSVPSHPDNTRNFPLLTSQYPSQSTHLPSSSSYAQHHPDYFTDQHLTPQHGHISPPIRSSQTQMEPQTISEEYPSFQSDDDVFGNVAQAPVPGFPRHSSVKPGQTTYLTDGNINLHPDLPLGMEDISSVLAPSSEQPSRIQPSSSHLTLPSDQHSDIPIDSSSNIPGYYINRDGNTKHWVMVTPNQSQYPSSGSLKSGKPWDRNQDYLHLAPHHPWSAVRASSQEPPLRLAQQPSISEFLYSPHSPPSHRSPVTHNTLPSKHSRDESLQHNRDPYYTPEHINDPFYYNEPTRPRSHSEGSRQRGRPDFGGSQNNGRPPYSSASYPDMSLPRQEQASSRPDARDPQFTYRSSDDQAYNPASPNKSMHQQHRPLPSSRDGTTDMLSRNFKSPSTLRDLHPAPRRGYTRSNFDDLNQYGDEAVAADSASHSSGIGSRNTSQSTTSYHPHLRGSAGKGSASFSSGQGHDMSLDMSGGHGVSQLQPYHQRDVSVDENYEFDSLNALENDIMDDLRRYSELSGGTGSVRQSEGNSQHDSSLPLPRKASQYPDSEQRFEKLREEFKQYRQQQYHLSDGTLQRAPMTTAALPIGTHGEPLYPMDSEML